MTLLDSWRYWVLANTILIYNRKWCTVLTLILVYCQYLQTSSRYWVETVLTSILLVNTSESNIVSRMVVTGAYPDPVFASEWPSIQWLFRWLGLCQHFMIILSSAAAFHKPRKCYALSGMKLNCIPILLQTFVIAYFASDACMIVGSSGFFILGSGRLFHCRSIHFGNFARDMICSSALVKASVVRSITSSKCTDFVAKQQNTPM